MKYLNERCFAKSLILINFAYKLNQGVLCNYLLNMRFSEKPIFYSFHFQYKLVNSLILNHANYFSHEQVQLKTLKLRLLF